MRMGFMPGGFPFPKDIPAMTAARSAIRSRAALRKAEKFRSMPVIR